MLKRALEWGSRDPGVATRKAVELCEGLGPIEVHYDCIGVGAAVKSEANRLEDDNLLPTGMQFVPWDAGAGVIDPLGHVEPGDPKSPRNEDFLENMKAQGWWALRMRFWRTYQAVVEGKTYPPEKLISISTEIAPRVLNKLKKELSQPTFGKSTRLRTLVNKQPKGSRSPNLGDMTMMLFWPARVSGQGFLDMARQESAERATQEAEVVKAQQEHLAAGKRVQDYERSERARREREAGPMPGASGPSAWTG